MAKWSIALYPPEGGPVIYSATNFGFQERSGALQFIDADTQKQLITTLPFLIHPFSPDLAVQAIAQPRADHRAAKTAS